MQKNNIKTAWQALQRLLANPEATEEVFAIIRALSGASLIKGCSRFAKTAFGQHILKNRIDLIETLKNRDFLAALPENTFGHHYLGFIQRQNISAQGLVEASDTEIATSKMSEDLMRFATRQRDSHDLWHTLTQYGRDELGELCLLAFTYAQTKNRGIGLIVIGGCFKIRHYYGWEVFNTVYQAYRASKKAKWLPGENWEELLKRSITEVREELRIHLPAHYQKLLSAPLTA